MRFVELERMGFRASVESAMRVCGENQRNDGGKIDMKNICIRII